MITRLTCPAQVRAQLHAAQRGACMYCGLPVAGSTTRHGGTVQLRTEWDHFSPLAYQGSNARGNWIMACHVCNRVKSGHVFPDVASARRYILARRIQLGYGPAMDAVVIMVEPENDDPSAAAYLAARTATGAPRRVRAMQCSSDYCRADAVMILDEQFPRCAEHEHWARGQL